jgi:hypothetical protein
MPYKISGTKSDTARIIIVDESGWSIESNTVVSGSGAYEIDSLVSGTKSVISRATDGEVIAYGNVIGEYYADPVLKDSYTEASNDFSQLRLNSTTTSVGLQFTPTSDYQITSVQFEVQKGNSPTGNIWTEVWSTSGGLPNTKLATSDFIDVSTLNPSAKEWKEWTFTEEISVTNGTVYGLILTGDFVIGAHYVLYYRRWIGTYGGAALFWNGSTWSTSANADHTFRVYGL